MTRLSLAVDIIALILAATLALGAFAFGHHVGWNAGYDRAFCFDTDHWCELNEARLEAALGYDVISAPSPELSNAIPPAYTEFIGKQLLDYLHSAFLRENREG